MQESHCGGSLHCSVALASTRRQLIALPTEQPARRHLTSHQSTADVTISERLPSTTSNQSVAAALAAPVVNSTALSLVLQIEEAALQLGEPTFAGLTATVRVEQLGAAPSHDPANPDGTGSAGLNVASLTSDTAAALGLDANRFEVVSAPRFITPPAPPPASPPPCSPPPPQSPPPPSTPTPFVAGPPPGAPSK
eukprot:6933820-Prymnesium_polylepis.1